MPPFEIIKAIFSQPFAIALAVFFFAASIFVHELGHYLAARWRGLKIERFSIGMGPRLFGWTDKQGVEWRISLLPLGGYVLLPQLADMRGLEGESHYNARELPPLSYTDKMAVAAAGAVFNVIFAFLICTALWIVGIPSEVRSDSTVVGVVSEEIEIEPDTIIPGPAFTAGLKPGDEIVAIDGDSIDNFTDLQFAIMSGTHSTEDGKPKATLTISRDGKTMDVVVHPIRVGREKIRMIGIANSTPVLIGKVYPQSPAEQAGLKAGDEILQVNQKKVFYYDAITREIDENPESPLNLLILRDGNEMSISMTPSLATVTESGKKEYKIGVGFTPKYENRHIDPVTQISNFVKQTYSTLAALLHPKSDLGFRNLSGPIGIVYILNIFAKQGIVLLLSMVAFININLAILNVLPIPVLDGGHMAFATWQKLTGRPLSARLIASLQGAVVLALLGMIVYVSFFDVLRIGDLETKSHEATIEPEDRPIAPVFETPAGEPAP